MCVYSETLSACLMVVKLEKLIIHVHGTKLTAVCRITVAGFLNTSCMERIYYYY